MSATISQLAQVSLLQENQPLYDAFNRMRVSSPETLVSLKQIYDKQPLFFDEVINGTATSVFSNASVVMSTVASGDYVIRQTKQRYNYQAGKSQNIKITFDNLIPETNIVKRVGYFSRTTAAPYNSVFDGLYLSTNDTEVNVNVAKGGTVTTVAQSAWNIDPLDGTGPSGVAIDRSKSQLVVLDFAWLGVGNVRWAIYNNGNIIYFHSSEHANVSDGVYILSPNQPICYEIRQTGAGSGSFTHICSEVESEGGHNPSAIGLVDKFDALTLATANNDYLIKAFRLASTRPDATIDFTGISAISTGNDNFEIALYLNPTIAGAALSYSAITNSALEVANGNLTTNLVSGGTQILSRYSLNSNNVSDIVNTILRIGTTTAGVGDVMALVIKTLSNGATFSGAISRNETI